MEDVKIKLAALWLIYAAIGLGYGVFMLMEQGVVDRSIDRLLDGSMVVGFRETATALRILSERNHVIAEGAGAVPVAAALSGRAGTGKMVCVISGGNIDSDKLIKILQGEVP